MSGQDAALTGPDLEAGIAVGAVPDGGVVAGHAGGVGAEAAAPDDTARARGVIGIRSTEPLRVPVSQQVVRPLVVPHPSDNVTPVAAGAPARHAAVAVVALAPDAVAAVG